MDPGGIGSFLSIVAIILGLVVAAHPESRFSRIFSMALGPVPRIGELKSKYLLRVSLVSAFWFVVLVAISWIAFLIARKNDVYLGSDGNGFLLFFVFGCFIAMSIISMVGSLAWSIGVRLFNRDGWYFEVQTDQDDNE